jgi:hypothetical protein
MSEEEIKEGSEPTQEDIESITEERLKTEGRFRNGANWFYWIAALSLINTIIVFSGGDWAFFFGLGVTQVVDVIAVQSPEMLDSLEVEESSQPETADTPDTTVELSTEQIGLVFKIVAIIVDTLAILFFGLLGLFANKRYKWAFIVGMVAYIIDGLIILLVGDYLGAGFHIFAFIGILSGYRALLKLQPKPKTADVVRTFPQ